MGCKIDMYNTAKQIFIRIRTYLTNIYPNITHNPSILIPSAATRMISKSVKEQVPRIRLLISVLD